MKKKLTIIGFDGKSTTVEFKTRNPEILQGRLKNHAQVFKPKKGKGSFKRDKRIVLDV